MRYCVGFLILIFYHSNSISQIVTSGNILKPIKTNYSLLIDSLSSTILSDPTNYSHFYQRAWLYFQARQHFNSLEDVNVFLKHFNQNYDGHLLLGKIHAARLNPIQAIEEFDIAIKIDPKNSAAYLQKSSVLASRSDLDYGFIFISNSIKQFRDEKEFYLYRAMILIKSSNYKKANSDLRQYIDSFKDGMDSIRLATAYFHSADAYLLNKDYKTALSQSYRCLKVCNYFYPVLGLRGEIKFKLGDLDGAISDINKMEEKGFKSSRCWKILGEAYEKKGNSTMACQYYSKYCEFFPKLDSYQQEINICSKFLKRNCKN